MFNRRVLCYGGCGSLENRAADSNIVVDNNDDILTGGINISQQLTQVLDDQKLDGIFCVAGGWAGGNAAHKDMIGYGMAKAAVHNLTRSLASKNNGLPDGVKVIAIAPVILDTPMNRKWMPNADTTTWTSLEDVARLFVDWLEDKNCPPSGSIIQLFTKDNVTECVPI